MVRVRVRDKVRIRVRFRVNWGTYIFGGAGQIFGGDRSIFFLGGEGLAVGHQ